ncbi:BAG family molecular chaperone regulator 6 [Salvia hispanica]|uniref:BAG family molecular chaperone regulator 6 n=1 Tax=Salvia hispanica TaxID=49212 RepID=UPI0020093595|nr:BAG family molecular chaperone regulator 6 [Salvia hispanica]
MEPVYMSIPPYPHQNGQVYYRPSCYPGMEARPPVSYESWPWGGNYGYAPPGTCHNCCNHAYMPALCAWGSPYSHVPPHHFPGHYPYSPVHYMPPPSHTVMPHPRYEYEKSVPMEHHCCGCRNHPPHQKEQRNVTIEEQEPEREPRKNDSLVPLQFKNSPYPIVWLPPDHNDGGKVKNTEVKKDTSLDVKEHENREPGEQLRNFSNGWLPLNSNNVVSSKEHGDGRETSRQDDGERKFQFPFFWIPYKPYDKEPENQKLKDNDAKPSLEPEKGSGGDQNFQVDGGNIGVPCASRVKDIPVKDVEQHVRQESSKNMEKEGDTSVKTTPGNGEKRVDEVKKVSPTDGSKKKSPSPPKSSKLPPVCLRVDPLPRKKSANAKSRSPSPPGDKEKLEVKSNEEVKVRPSEKVEESTDKKTIAVVDGNTLLEKSTKVTTVETPVQPLAKSQGDVSMKQAEEKPEEETDQNHSETHAAIKEQSEDIVSTGGEKEESFRDEEAGAGKKCSKRELSEEEAAVIIQSAYRRFDVGRWKPIEKLRQIARVREEIADVKSLIQKMELTADIQSRSKQKNIISETIMSLLLRLDTIQGLHPIIREVRKSVVKELVNLQEQLDTIICEKPEDSQGQESVVKHDQEDLLSKSIDVVSSEDSNEINIVDSQNQIEGGSGPESAEFPEVNPVNEATNVITGAEAAESCVDEAFKSEKDLTTKDGDVKSANPIDEAASVERGVEAAESPVDEGVKVAQGSATKDEEENSNEVHENEETSIAKEDCEPIILGQGCELSPLLDDSSARETDVAQTEDQDTFQSEMAELPLGVVDDLCAAEGMNHSADSSKTELSRQLEEELHSADLGKADQHQPLEEGMNHSVDSSKAELSRQLGEVPHSADSSKSDQHLQQEEGTNHSADSSKAELSQQLEEVPHSADSSKADQHLQLEEALTGSHTVEESHSEIVNEENHQTETEEEANHKMEDATSESNECTFQQPVAQKLEFAEASGEREVTSIEEPQENSEMGDSTLDEMTGQLVQEVNMEERGFTNEDEVSMAGVESTTAAKSCDGTADVEQGAADANHSRGVSEMGVLSKEGEQCHPPPKDAAEDENSAVGDDMRESSRKLMEEKERLQEMVAKLIETGQEQLMAISSLSGRVKELEKKLNKKKVRVKKARSPRSSSGITKFDTSGPVGVAV